MKFEIQRNLSNDFEIYKFDLVDPEKQNFWVKWRNCLIIAFIVSIITGLALLYLFPGLLKDIEVQISNNRSTTVLLRNKDEHKIQGDCTSSDGVAASSDPTSQSVEGKN